MNNTGKIEQQNKPSNVQCNSGRVDELLGCGETIDRIWFIIKNLNGYDLVWESMEENKNGEYLNRKEILNSIEEFKNKVTA